VHAGVVAGAGCGTVAGCADCEGVFERLYMELLQRGVHGVSDVVLVEVGLVAIVSF
jgi:hypothetical protein